MSSLWTPGGEHPVGDERAGDDTDAGLGSDDTGADLDDDQRRAVEEALAEELAEARRRVADTPPEAIVVNHAMGLYELAAIHLSSSPANLAGASLAIDAFAALVEGLGARLGSDVAVLRDALAQVRLAFVQVKASAGEAPQTSAGEAPQTSAGEAPQG